MCFGCSDGSFEYPQHMFWLRNKENGFKLRTLIWSPDIVIQDVFFNLHRERRTKVFEGKIVNIILTISFIIQKNHLSF